MKYYKTDTDWLGEAPLITSDMISEELEADVVIAGAGHAGLQAALAAAEEGASVIVIESMNEEHYKVYGEDIGVWNSKWLIDKGYGPYRTGDIVNEYFIRTGGRVNPELIRQYVQGSGEAFDHMVGLVERESGRSFDEVFKYGSGDDGELIVHVQKDVEQYPIELGGFRTWAGAVQFVGEITHEPIRGCAAHSKLNNFMLYAVNESKRLGACWRYSTLAVELVQNENGDVTGVIAQDKKDRHYIKINAKKAVLVSTGDFASDKKMCTALLTEAAEWAERFGDDSVKGPGRNGSGHKMCCWAGGTIEPSPRPVMNLGGGPQAPWGMGPMLMLNSDGKRFSNEAAQAVIMGAVARQPRGLIAGITDADYMRSVVIAGIEHGAPNYGRPVYYEELEDDIREAVKEENRQKALTEGITCRGTFVIERNPSKVYVADTLDELLKALGYDDAAAKTALEQIAHYNELCHKGEDIDFGKDQIAMIPIEKAPFIGVKGENKGQKNIGLVTLAGLETDDKMNVIRPDGTKIKGLYVAGNTLGGRFGIGYATPTAGTSIGMAMTHGRIVGKTMAAL